MNRLVWGRVIGVLSQLAGIGLLLVSAWLIVRAAERPPVLYLMVAIVSVRFFGLARATLRYVERLLTHDAAFALVTDARVRIYADLDRAAPSGAGTARRGDLVSRVVSDVDAILDRLLRLRGPWIVAIASTGAVALLVGWIDLRSGLVVAVTSAVSMILIRAVVPWSVREAGSATAGWRGDVAAGVSQAVLAGPELAAHGAGALVLTDVHDKVARLAAAERRGAWVTGLGQAVVLMATGLSVGFVAMLSGGVPPVLAGVIVLAPLALVEPLEALADAERLRPAIEAAERRLAVLSVAPAPVAEVSHPVVLPIRFDLDVKDVGVGWVTTVADHLTFALPEGGVLAITGPSGSGKSTLALTLARLLEPTTGRIILGGTDVRSLRPSDVRSVIGVLGQDEIVFDTTIRENLRIADPRAHDSAMDRALKLAGLDVFVSTLPKGLDTRVGEHGNRLSGGERQRLCLARLLLADHRVIVVDEPTEHLDMEAADALIDDLLGLAGERSIVVISHSADVLARVGTVIRLGESVVTA